MLIGGQVRFPEHDDTVVALFTAKQALFGSFSPEQFICLACGTRDGTRRSLPARFPVCCCPAPFLFPPRSCILASRNRNRIESRTKPAHRSGLGALELFALGLKATGAYVSRALSYHGAGTASRLFWGCVGWAPQAWGYVWKPTKHVFTAAHACTILTASHAEFELVPVDMDPVFRIMYDR